MSGPETGKVAHDSSVLNGSLKELTLSVKSATARAVGEIATIKGDISTLRAERKVLQQELAQEERAFRDHCDELKRLDAELNALRSEVDASRSQLTSLRQQRSKRGSGRRPSKRNAVRSAIAEKGRLRHKRRRRPPDFSDGIFVDDGPASRGRCEVKICVTSCCPRPFKAHGCVSRART